jgi:hypothetical protein
MGFVLAYLKHTTVEAEIPPFPDQAIMLIVNHLQDDMFTEFVSGDASYLLWRRSSVAGWIYMELQTYRRLVNVWCVESEKDDEGIPHQKRVRYESVDLLYHANPVKVLEYHANRVSRGDN